MASDLGLWLMGYALLLTILNAHKLGVFDFIMANIIYIIGGLTWLLN